MKSSASELGIRLLRLITILHVNGFFFMFGCSLIIVWNFGSKLSTSRSKE